jgi:hypothetical protein
MAGPSLFSIIEMLPQILFALQIIMYIVLAWILGSLAFRGLHKKIPFAIWAVTMFGTGFLCLIIGTALANYMFFFEGTILQTVQMDLFLGGLLGALILASAFHMITRKEKGTDKGSITRKLQERVSLLEGLLLKHNVPTIREGDARKTAESLVPGFVSKRANLKGSDWEVLLEREDRKAVVVMGAYTGEVKKVEHTGEIGFFSDPLRIIGVALIITVVAFSMFNFRGFPSMLEGVASLLGMNPEQFEMLTGGGEVPEGCVPTIRILMKHGVSVLGGEASYTNENVKNIIERETGRQVALMYEKDFEDKNYIISITLPMGTDLSDLTNENIVENSEICTSTEEILCDCIKIPDINVPTGFIVAV